MGRLYAQADLRGCAQENRTPARRVCAPYHSGAKVVRFPVRVFFAESHRYLRCRRRITVRTWAMNAPAAIAASVLPLPRL
jgi:hypothetical protein